MTQRVPVFFDGFELGAISVGETGALGFEYGPDWLETRGAFPLSTTIPLRSGPHAPEIVEPWLANLLPEERQLAMVARSLGLDRTDALAILREIGADTAGALSFGAPSDRRAWIFTPLRDPYDAPDDATALGRHIDDLDRRPLLVGEDGVRQSLAGGQKKSALAVAARNGDPVLRLPEAGDVFTVPRFGAPSTIIVKPDNPALPGIVENEAYCLHLAKAVGIGAVAVTTLAAGWIREGIGAAPPGKLRADARCLRRAHARFSTTDSTDPLDERWGATSVSACSFVRTGPLWRENGWRQDRSQAIKLSFGSSLRKTGTSDFFCR